MQGIRLEGVSKRFGAVEALRGVSFALRPGEVHALVGENGAGKSTLIKVMAGVYRPDAGRVLLDDAPVVFGHPGDAAVRGVAVIYQELAQYPDLSVLENLFVGPALASGPLGLVDWRALRQRAQSVFARLGVSLDLDAPASELSTAQGQLVEIARALSREARILIMDEPTASLTQHDTQVLYGVVRRLRAQGVAILYISHRLEEVFALADRVTVLRDGASVASEEVAAMTPERLIALMVGRELEHLYPEREAALGPPVLEVCTLSQPGVLHDVSLTVCAGEIVGLAGLVGSGRSELARCLFGIEPYSGEVRLGGARLPRTPWGAIAAGMAYLSEDRKLEGLVLPMDIRDNVSLPNLPRVSRAGLFDRRRASALAERFVRALRIRAPGVHTRAADLSGGNQQKVALAKWLAAEPRLLILDEPTRGVDVGAKAEIHRLMTELCGSGMAILMISSELPEILGMSDRILVMRGGCLRGELRREHADQESVMRLAAGVA